MSHLSADQIMTAFRQSGGLDLQVCAFDALPSTNSWLVERAADYHSQQVLCVAEAQTQGRGRRGKVWSSPQQGVTLSCLNWLPVPATKLSGLSLVAGMALVDHLSDYGVDNARVKWPNDILCDGKKLAGILIELVHVDRQGCGVVTGIGLNYQEGAMHGVDQPMTCLSNEIATDLPSRSVLIGRLVARLHAAYRQFLLQGFAPFQQRWAEYDAFHNSELKVTQGQSILAGRSVGINEQGLLLLETAEGIQSFSSGEVSVRRAQS